MCVNEQKTDQQNRLNMVIKGKKVPPAFSRNGTVCVTSKVTLYEILCPPSVHRFLQNTLTNMAHVYVDGALRIQRPGAAKPCCSSEGRVRE